MWKVGITGGMGSGKTTVCRLFEALGIPVYYADERAKHLMRHDEGVRAALTAAFGPAAYLPDGSPNRAHLAQAFADPAALARLNAIVHPAVAADEAAWQQAQQGHTPYTLKEAAILFESGSYRNVDKVIVVYAPKALRLQRAMQRDGLTAEAVEARMARQMPEEEKLARADFVIHNDGTQLLVPQVVAIHGVLVGAPNKIY